MAFEELHVGTIGEPIEVLLKNPDGTAYDLTGQTALEFKFSLNGGATVCAEIRGVTVTDTALHTRDLSLDEGDTMFVNIETDRGVLQFVAYNSHNGYYGQTAYVLSTQLRHEATL